MRFTKRALSLLMAIVMLFTMAAPAFAVGGSPYTVEIVAGCSDIMLDRNDGNGLVKQGKPVLTFNNVAYTESDPNLTTAIGQVLGIVDISAEYSHNSARQLVGWNIYLKNGHGHEIYNGGHVYSTSEILSMSLSDIQIPAGDINGGYSYYVQFHAVWDDSEFLYHSNVDYCPFYGTIEWSDGRLFTDDEYAFTGASHCHGQVVGTTLTTNTQNYVSDNGGSFQGWVMVEYEWADIPGGRMRDVEISTDNSGNLIIYQFSDILKADDNDTVFHTAPTKNRVYLAKWSDMPDSAYFDFGKVKSKVKIEFFGGNAEVINGQGSDPVTYPDPNVFNIFAEGRGFDDIGFAISSVSKTGDTFEGFYSYRRGQDGSFALVTDENDVPVLTDISTVNTAKYTGRDVIYVAKWQNIANSVYFNLWPNLESNAGIPMFPVSFDILGGYAVYDLTTDDSDPDQDTGINGSTGDAMIHAGDRLEHNVFKTLQRTDANDAPVQNVTVSGWAVYTKGQNGTFDFLQIVNDYSDYKVQGDTVFAPVWSDVDVNDPDNMYVKHHPERGGGNGGGEDPEEPEAPMTFHVGFDLYGGSVYHLGDTANPVTGQKGEAQFDVNLVKGSSFSTQVGSSNFVSDGIKDDKLGEFEGWLMFQVWLPMIPGGDGKFHANTDSDLENNIDYYDEDNEKFIPLTTAQVLDTYIYHEDLIWVAKWSNIPDSEYLNHVTDFPSNEQPAAEATILFELGEAESVTLTFADPSRSPITLTEDTVLDKAAIGIEPGKNFEELGITVTAVAPETTDTCRFDGFMVKGSNGDEARFDAGDLPKHYFIEGQSVVTPVFRGPGISFSYDGADLALKVDGKAETRANNTDFNLNYVAAGTPLTIASSGITDIEAPVFYTTRTFVGWNIYISGEVAPINDAPVEWDDLEAYALPKGVEHMDVRAVWQSEDGTTEDSSEYLAHVVFDVLDGTAYIDRNPDNPEEQPGWSTQGLAMDRPFRKQGTLGQQLGREFPSGISYGGKEDEFKGWYMITRDEDGKFAFVIDEQSTDGAPKLIPNATVKGTVPSEETYYVAKYTSKSIDEYNDYVAWLNSNQGGEEPDEPGEEPDDGEGEILDTTNGFWVGFDLFGGTAMHFPKGIEEDGGEAEMLGPNPLGYSDVKTQIANDTVFSDIHGEKFIYDPAFNGDEEAFLGWLAFADVDADGNEDGVYKFVGDDLDDVYTTKQVLGMVYDEANIIWVAKWDGVNELSYAGYATRMSHNGETASITFELSNATSVEVVLADESVIELDANAPIFKTSDEAGKTLAELGVTDIVSALDTDNYNMFGGWNVIYGENYDFFENAQDFIQRFQLPDGDVLIRPVYYGAAVNLDFPGAVVTITRGELAEPVENSYFFLCEYDENGNSLLSSGIDSVSNPVFYTEREFLGWNIYKGIETEDSYEKQLVNSDYISSENIVNYVFPKDAVEVRFEAVWADDEEYLTAVVFDVVDGYAIIGREYDEDGNIVEGAEGELFTGFVYQNEYVKRNVTLEDQLGAEYPIEMEKPGAEFQGWLKVNINDDSLVLDEAAGVLSDEAVRETMPTEAVIYIAKWSDRDMAYYNDYLKLLVAEESGYWIIIGNGGSVEVSGDIGNTHRAEVASGYVPVDISIADGMFYNDSYEIYNSGSVAFNAFREQYSLVGWNVYKEDGIRAYTKVPQGQEPEIPDGDIFMYYGYTGMIDPETEEMVMYDEYVVFSGCTSLVSGISTEDLFKLPKNERLILIPVWEEVEPDNVDIPDSDEEHAVQVQQGVVEVPEIPADPNDPNSEPMYESMEQVKEALENAIAEVVDRDVSGREKTVFMEIKLMVKQENPVTNQEEWVEVTDPDVIPPEGIEVIIPFPELAGKSGFKYVITHLNSKTGEIEVYDEDDYEITDKGLKIRVTSLSPFAVYYEEITSGGQGDVTVTPTTPGESAPGRQNPNTGVHF